MYVCFQSAL